MNHVSKVFVGGASLDDVARLLGPALSRELVPIDGGHEALGLPWILVTPNRITEELDVGDIGMHTYPIVVTVEESDDRLDVARKAYDALSAAGYRAMLYDDGDTFVERHDPEQRHSAAG